MIPLELLTRSLVSVLLNAQPAPIRIGTFLLAGNQLLRSKGRLSFLCYVVLLTFACYRWIYALILTIDANFRLKNKDRKVTSDPPLGDGWGHWVPKEPYHDYIAKYGFQEEVCFAQNYDSFRRLMFCTRSPTCVIQPYVQSTTQIRRSRRGIVLLG
jgi:hypothetical protein